MINQKKGYSIKNLRTGDVSYFDPFTNFSSFSEAKLVEEGRRVWKDRSYWPCKGSTTFVGTKRLILELYVFRCSHCGVTWEVSSENDIFLWAGRTAWLCPNGCACNSLKDWTGDREKPQGKELEKKKD